MSAMIDAVLHYARTHRAQITKFVVVGLITFGINFMMFHVFYGGFGLDYRISVSLAYVITVISHFLLHRFFTFEAGEQQMVQNVSRYTAMLVLNYGITVFAAWFVVELLRVSPYWSVIASTMATACTSFFVMKYFVFGQRQA